MSIPINCPVCGNKVYSYRVDKCQALACQWSQSSPIQLQPAAECECGDSYCDIKPKPSEDERQKCVDAFAEGLNEIADQLKKLARGGAK